MGEPIPLKAGDDSRKNWRTINDVMAGLKTTRVRADATDATVHALNRLRKDAGEGSDALRVKSVEAEHTVCRTWDGTTEGTVDILVAKPFSARQPASETIAGVAFTYAYSTGPDALNDLRDATWATGAEEQIVTPYWLVDGLIHVMTVAYSGVTVEGADLKLIEVSARCWARTS